MEDLRGRLYRVVAIFFVVFFCGLFSAGEILKRVLKLVQIDQVVIAATSPFQYINLAMNVGFFLAITVSVPYLMYTLYVFAAPALAPRERRELLKAIPISAGLFISGFFYGLFILYYALGVLASINTRLGIANFWNIGQFLSEMLVTAVLLGLVFEFPLLLFLLIKLGIIRTQILRDNRHIAYLLALGFTALLPPTDIISLLAMTLPLVLLYEGVIVLGGSRR